MKKIFALLLLATCDKSILLYANCDNLKTRDEIILCQALEIIKVKESFMPNCYADGHTKKGKVKHSIGFGMAEGSKNNNYCQNELNKLKKHNIRYRLVPDYILIKKIQVNQKEAEAMTLETLQSFLKRLKYNYKLLAKKNLLDVYSNIQIATLLDRIYRAGETRFYKEECKVWQMLISSSHLEKSYCVKIAKAFMEGSRMSGVKARYHSELLLFTANVCFYDIKFQNTLLN